MVQPGSPPVPAITSEYNSLALPGPNPRPGFQGTWWMPQPSPACPRSVLALFKCWSLVQYGLLPNSACMHADGLCNLAQPNLTILGLTLINGICSLAGESPKFFYLFLFCHPSLLSSFLPSLLSPSFALFLPVSFSLPLYLSSSLYLFFLLETGISSFHWSSLQMTAIATASQSGARNLFRFPLWMQKGGYQCLQAVD